MKASALSGEELEQLESWLSANEKSLPEHIVRLQRRVIMISKFFGDLSARNSELLTRLREFMGLSPKSEKGSQLANQLRGIFIRRSDRI